MWLGFKLSESINKQRSETSINSKVINEASSLILSQYVDTINPSFLYSNALKGMINSLDPHTTWISSDELPAANEELEGSFYGIGVEFFFFHDTFTVSYVIEGSPAQQSKLLPGDKIVAVNDSLIAGKKLSHDDVLKKIKGALHSQVKLRILRPDGTGHTAIVTRGAVPLHSVTHACMLPDNTGYLSLRMFSETTYQEFAEVLTSMKKQGMQQLIIDVRDNPGGYMEAVGKICNELIDKVDTLLVTKGNKHHRVIRAQKGGLFTTGKLAILINEHAASASEILAGVIQDLDRGIIIGRRSYGKGLVQEQYELADGSALRLTTARYYLPSGRCIQKPYEDKPLSYHHEIEDRFEKGELDSTLKVSHYPRDRYTTRKGRTVYGHEGIRPDVFCPINRDTKNQLAYDELRTLVTKIANDYCFLYQKQLDTLSSPKALYDNQQVQSSALNYLHQYIRDQNHKYSHKLNNPDKLLQDEYLALIAKAKWGKSAYKQIQYTHDYMIEMALEYLSKNN